MKRFLADVERAVDLVDVNVAAGLCLQRLAEQKARRLTRMLWVIALSLFASELLPFGPLDLGLIPDAHLFQWTTGHPYAVHAGHALYHVDVESPHVLGVRLPWDSVYGR